MDSKLTPKEEELLAADDRASARFGYWIVGLIALVLATFAIPVVQAITWLKTGSWPILSFREALSLVGFELASASWVGVQRIADWILDLPLFVVLFFAIVVAGYLLSLDANQSEALRTARMKRARQAAGRKS